MASQNKKKLHLGVISIARLSRLPQQESPESQDYQIISLNNTPYYSQNSDNGTTNRNNTEPQTTRFSLGNKRDYESVAKIAKGRHHQHLLQTYQLRIEHQ